MGLEIIVFYLYNISGKKSFISSYTKEKEEDLSMGNAYKAYWKRYFDFKGRTSRSNFWWAILAQFIVSIIVGFLARMLDTNAVSSLWSLITFIPGLSMNVRRLHDVDRSGWLILAAYVPIVLLMVSTTLTTASFMMNAETATGGFGLATMVFFVLTMIAAIYFLILFVKKGEPGANRYGMPDEN